MIEVCTVYAPLMIIWFNYLLRNCLGGFLNRYQLLFPWIPITYFPGLARKRCLLENLWEKALLLTNFCTCTAKVFHIRRLFLPWVNWNISNFLNILNKHTDYVIKIEGCSAHITSKSFRVFYHQKLKLKKK